jgi:hypothetical protein
MYAVLGILIRIRSGIGNIWPDPYGIQQIQYKMALLLKIMDTFDAKEKHNVRQCKLSLLVNK